MNYTEEYKARIQQEYDEKISDTNFWREFLQGAFLNRTFLVRQLESKDMDSIGAIAFHAKMQGEIAGIDKVIRLVLKILERERVAGISGIFPGF